MGKKKKRKQASRIAGGFFTDWTLKEAPNKAYNCVKIINLLEKLWTKIWKTSTMEIMKDN